MDYSQQNSVFRPGLTMRGPVYNANPSMGAYLSAIPTVNPNIKLAIEIGLLVLGATKKLSLPVAIVAAVAVWKFLPDTSAAAPVSSGLNPADVNAPPPPFDTSQLQIPTVGIPSV